MNAQIEQLKKLFEYLGFDADTANTTATSFLTPADGTDPSLPIDNILLQAQEYAIPHVTPRLKKDLSPQFKGQYIGEAINKIIAMSDGALKRQDFDHKGEGDDNLSRALSAILELKGQKGGTKQDDSETAKKLNDALAKITEWEEKYNNDTTSIRNEYAEKENSRQVYDFVMSKISNLQKDGKKQELNVAPDHAAKSILRELQEVAQLKYDEQNKTVNPFSKDNPEVKYTDGTKAVSIDELINTSLSRNNWIKQSNGGSSNANQFTQRQGQQQQHQQQQSQQGQPGRSSFREQLEAATGNAA